MFEVWASMERQDKLAIPHKAVGRYTADQRNMQTRESERNVWQHRSLGDYNVLLPCEKGNEMVIRFYVLGCGVVLNEKK